MLCHIYYDSLSDDIYQKCQRAVIRILLLEDAKIIEVYSKAIVVYDRNRMKQNLVYDCVQNCKIKQRITPQSGQNILLLLQKCEQHLMPFLQLILTKSRMLKAIIHLNNRLLSVSGNTSNHKQGR
jgi:hypothetical protein